MLQIACVRQLKRSGVILSCAECSSLVLLAEMNGRCHNCNLNLRGNFSPLPFLCLECEIKARRCLILDHIWPSLGEAIDRRALAAFIMHDVKVKARRFNLQFLLLRQQSSLSAWFTYPFGLLFVVVEISLFVH